MTKYYKPCEHCGHLQQAPDIEGFYTKAMQKLERIGKLIRPYNHRGVWSTPLVGQICRDIEKVLTER